MPPAWRKSIPGILPSTLWARLRRFKIAPGDFVQWLEYNMRRAISIRRLQSVVDELLGRERETFGADRRPRDLAAQPFEFVMPVGGGNHAGIQREPIGPRRRALVITRTRESLPGPAMHLICGGQRRRLRPGLHHGASGPYKC